MGKESDRFVKVYSQGGGFGPLLQIWVDRATGVNYLWKGDGYAGGLTPLLNRDGKPVITTISSTDP